MATADQLKALLKAYVSDDRAQFTSVAMQIAANEAKAGHGKLAEELEFMAKPYQPDHLDSIVKGIKHRLRA